MVHMKEIAQSYLWWFGFIHGIGGGGDTCIYIKFAGPFEDRMFLVVLDAHSNWPELPS
jgi:hypothetical protein